MTNRIEPGIYREKLAFETNFVIAPNAWLRDSVLSLKAKGLLIYFLTHSDGYVITFRQILRENQDGKAAIRSAVDELIQAGYLRTERTTTDRGYNSGLAYYLQNPKSENPTLENPTLENQTAYKKTTISEEDKEIKNLNVDDFFNQFWNAYPKKTEKLDARRVFDKVIRKVPIEVILKGVENLRNDPAKQTIKFLPNPAKWLRNGGWEDEPVGAILPQLSNEEWEARIKEFWG